MSHRRHVGRSVALHVGRCGCAIHPMHSSPPTNDGRRHINADHATLPSHPTDASQPIADPHHTSQPHHTRARPARAQPPTRPRAAHAATPHAHHRRTNRRLHRRCRRQHRHDANQSKSADRNANAYAAAAVADRRAPLTRAPRDLRARLDLPNVDYYWPALVRGVVVAAALSSSTTPHPLSHKVRDPPIATPPPAPPSSQPPPRCAARRMHSRHALREPNRTCSTPPYVGPTEASGSRRLRLRPHQRRAARHVATHERHQAQHQRIRHSRHNHRRAAPPADDTSATRSARQVGLAQQRLRVALPRFRGRGCSGCAFSHTAAPPATTQRATSTHRDAAANAAVVTTADALRRPPLARPPCAPRAKSDWATTPAPTPTPPSSQPPTHCAERRWHIRRGLRAPGRTCSTTSSRGPVEVSGARLSGMRPKGWSGRQRLVIACRVGVAMSDFPQQRRVVSRWLRG